MMSKREKRQIRHKRVRAKVWGTSSRPRLCVFKSGKYIYAQLIDDEKHKILLSASGLELKSKKASSKEGKEGEDKKIASKSTSAAEVGRLIGKKAQEKKIAEVVFDRGGYKYHGRIKALAEGARSAGLKF
jgi:large subunit ribosomal protein L18